MLLRQRLHALASELRFFICPRLIRGLLPHLICCHSSLKFSEARHGCGAICCQQPRISHRCPACPRSIRGRQSLCILRPSTWIFWTQAFWSEVQFGSRGELGPHMDTSSIRGQCTESIREHLTLDLSTTPCPSDTL